MPLIENIAGPLAGTALGLMLQKQNDARQIKQQGKLTGMQVDAQKQLTDYNYGKQMQMWNDTNYKAQMEQLRKAGLNPGLIYGMGGSGGQSTNIAQGSTTGGQAPQGGGEVQAMTGMGIQTAAQMALLKAQKENIEADTANKQAENPNIPKAGTKIDTEVKNLELDAEFKKKSLNDRIDIINTEANRAITELHRSETQLGLDRATVLQKATIIGAEAIGAVLQNALTEAQISKTKQDIVHSKAQVQQMAEQLLQGWEALDNQAKEIKIKEFLAEFQANHPGISQLVGGAIQRIADGIIAPLKGRQINK